VVRRDPAEPLGYPRDPCEARGQAKKERERRTF